MGGASVRSESACRALHQPSGRSIFRYGLGVGVHTPELDGLICRPSRRWCTEGSILSVQRPSVWGSGKFSPSTGRSSKSRRRKRCFRGNRFIDFAARPTTPCETTASSDQNLSRTTRLRMTRVGMSREGPKGPLTPLRELVCSQSRPQKVSEIAMLCGATFLGFLRSYLRKWVIG